MKNNKNSINQVAKTYQRLVEAQGPDDWEDPAPTSPPDVPRPQTRPIRHPYIPMTDSEIQTREMQELIRILNSFDNTPQPGSGRNKTIQMAVAALIAAGALAYLTYEELMQMVEDYFNPPVQVDVPQNFTPYISPYQQTINNLGSQQGGYIPGGIFGR